KLAVRKWKCEALPPDHQYSHEKYDAAFEAGIMSDDEDTLGAMGKKTKQFSLHQLLCASKELRDLWAVIDAVPHPDPAIWSITRIRGSDKDEPPKKCTKLAGRFQRWMIDSEWLPEITHLKYDVPRRVSGSGVAWGDIMDPEDEEEAKIELNSGKRKKVKGMMGASK
ncbi:hypothetical protein JB92DRAFT_2719558, partial [Gautieria morchelliformis]